MQLIAEKRNFDRRCVACCSLLCVRGTASPNTDNDKSVTSNNVEMQLTSVPCSDETITVKIMNDTLSDLE